MIKLMLGILLLSSFAFAGTTDKSLTANKFKMLEAYPGNNTITLQPPSFTTDYTLTFPTDDGTAAQVLTTNGSGTLSWTTPSSGGSKNYILNPAAEVDTTGWVTYSNTAGVSPVSGAGTAPNADFTFTRSTTTPLRDTGQFLLTHTANNRQGSGVSYDFTIDVADKAKVQKISFDYDVTTGVMADADISVWIYDVTNSLLIQPAPVSLPNVISGAGGAKWNGSFQAASNSTSYRLILHNSTATASAFTLALDNVVVGPQTNAIGGSVSDWIAFTPTGSWSTNTTYTGYWRRVGDSLEWRVRLALSGAPTSAGLSINFLPSGLTADTSKILATSTTKAMGYGTARVAGSDGELVATYSTTTAIIVMALNSAGTYIAASQQVTNTLPGAFASGDSIELTGVIPIVGWGSNQVLSDQTDTRVVSFAGLKTGSQAVTLDATNITTDTTSKDTHGAWSGSLYTVPVSGDYVVAFNLGTTSTAARFDVYKNATLLTALASTDSSGTHTSGSAVVPGLKAGDTLSVRSHHTLTINALGGISIFRLSGPSQIAASESVTWKYYDTASTSYPNGPTSMTFGTKEIDSHGIVTSSIATIPISGKYMICGKFKGAGNQSSNFDWKIQAYKNSTTSYLLAAMGSAAGGNLNYGLNGCSILQLISGDTIALRITTNGVANMVSSSTADEVVFEGYKVGN